MKKFKNAGITLKLYRDKTELTQVEYADKVGCDSQFVSNWERGLCLPPEKVFKKMERELARSGNTLLVMEYRKKFINSAAQDYANNLKKRLGIND